MNLAVHNYTALYLINTIDEFYQNSKIHRKPVDNKNQ